MVDNLRKKAEKEVAAREARATKCPTDEEAQRLLHELRVHQIELEMQNEELRRIHAELEVSRARFFDLFDLAPIGFLTFDKMGVILEANSTASKMLEEAKEAMIGKPLSRFIYPEDQDIFYHYRKKAREVGETLGFELRIVKKNGSFFWARFEAAGATDVKGEPIFRVVMSDITEKRQALVTQQKMEQQLQINQRLQSLGVLAGGIAHDFNNLLTGIFGYIDLAQTISTDHKITQYLSKALLTIDRTRGLTRQLLTFSSGGAPIKKVGWVSECVREAVDFALSGSNVSCRYEISEALWPCSFDKNQVAQVIHNIIINAQQAMPAGGVIDLSMTNVMTENADASSAKEMKNSIKISIKDNGVGIPKKNLPHIFDPFFTTKEKGSGLGLAISFSIVRRHGGSIEVESEPGVGTVFSVLLPALPAEAKLPSLDAKRTVIAHRGSGRILVMDDEEVIREVLGTMLRAFGYSVVCTREGNEALAYFEEETRAERPFAGLVFDLTIPGGMGGKDLVKEIRKIDSKVPVFVASGYTDDAVMVCPQAYGFTASIGKPFNLSELSELLNKNLKCRS